MFNNAQIVLKSMSAEQLEQLRQRQKVKLDIPLVIDFIIPNEFNDMMRKKNSFVLVLPKVIEELVQVSSLKILILQHLKLEVEFLPTGGVWSHGRLICYYFANSPIQELFYWVLV